MSSKIKRPYLLTLFKRPCDLLKHLKADYPEVHGRMLKKNNKRFNVFFDGLYEQIEPLLMTEHQDDVQEIFKQMKRHCTHIIAFAQSGEGRLPVRSLINIVLMLIGVYVAENNQDQLGEDLKNSQASLIQIYDEGFAEVEDWKLDYIVSRTLKDIGLTPSPQNKLDEKQP